MTVVVREIEPSDGAAIAALRRAGFHPVMDDPGFEARLVAWLSDEADRRTTWLALWNGGPAGMASLFEYRRMPRPGRPDSRWGYVGNMFVREELRGRGIGTALLTAIIGAADERRYARLVVSPAPEALSFYRRAGFLAADETTDDHRLLVRPAPS